MWDRVSVIFARDDYSLAIARSMSRRAEDAGVCFDSFNEVGDTTATIAANGSSSTAVLVVSPPEDAQNITMRLSSGDHQFQWLFSQPWSAEETDLLEQLTNRSDVFALSVAPIVVDLFEIHWNKRKNPNLEQIPENVWTLEYLAQLKKCNLPQWPRQDASWFPCHNLNVAETALDRVLRHTRLLPAIHVINTFASAFRKAWEMKCSSESGYCTALKEMTRVQFMDDIFQSLDLQHDGPGNRIPPGFIGSRKVSSSNKISDVKFSLIYSKPSPDGDHRIEEILSYQKSAGITTVDKSFAPKSVRCPRTGCNSCASFRAGRFGLPEVTNGPGQRSSPQAASAPAPAPEPEPELEPEPEPEPEPVPESIPEVETDDVPVVSEGHQPLDDDIDESESIVRVHKTGNPDPNSIQVTEVKTPVDDEVDIDETEGSSSEEDDEEEESNNTHSIIIPALFPVHRSGPTPLQCSAEINPETIQDIEAFLWALDHVNQNVELLNGLEIGAVIFDTCSSPIKAAHLVSSVLAKEGDPMLDEVNIDPERLFTVVSVSSAEETEAAASVLSPAGITTLSAKDRGDSLTSAPHQLQVKIKIKSSPNIE